MTLINFVIHRYIVKFNILNSNVKGCDCTSNVEALLKKAEEESNKNDDDSEQSTETQSKLYLEK